MFRHLQSLANLFKPTSQSMFMIHRRLVLLCCFTMLLSVFSWYIFQLVHKYVVASFILSLLQIKICFPKYFMFISNHPTRIMKIFCSSESIFHVRNEQNPCMGEDYRHSCGGRVSRHWSSGCPLASLSQWVGSAWPSPQLLQLTQQVLVTWRGPIF